MKHGRATLQRKLELWQNRRNTAKNRGRRWLVRQVHILFFRDRWHSRGLRNKSSLRSTILKLFNDNKIVLLHCHDQAIILQRKSSRAQQRGRQHRGICGRDTRAVKMLEDVALADRRGRSLFVGPLLTETVECRHCRLEGVTAQRVEVVIWLFLGTAAVLRCRERKGLCCGHCITVCACPDRTTWSLFVTRRCGTCKKRENNRGRKNAGKFCQHRKRRETGVVEKKSG